MFLGLLQYKYATCLDKFYITLAVIFSTFTGIANAFISVTFGEAAGAIINYAGAENKTSHEKRLLMEGIYIFVIENCVLGVIALISTYCSTILFNYSALRQIYKIRLRYFDKILDQDIPWHDVHETGDFASRMSTDLKKIEEGMGELISVLVVFFVQFSASLVMALYIGWELTLVCLASFPVCMGSMVFMIWISSKLTNKEMDAYGAAGALAEETFTAIRTVVAFDGQKIEKQMYDELLIKAKNNNIRRSLFTSISNGLMWFFTYGSFSLSFWYGTTLMVRDKKLNNPGYNPEIIIVIFGCMLTATISFGMAAPYLEIVSAAKGASQKIFAVIDSTPIINQSKNSGAKPSKINGDIVFKNVTFHYPSRPTITILENFNLTIKSGETVALVGSSGCGKSTCIQLVQRYYDPPMGKILIDGNDVKRLDLTWFRKHIGVVGQEPVLFEATIAENIRLGNRNATRGEIETASKKANAHSFIVTLHEGYDTLIGERGVQLSGGQKQRIAIARALVRQPTILLLDEATSALDTKSEAVVQAALDTASTGCTTIIVAHRLSTVRRANRIIVMANGKIKESGSHAQLMAAKGVYYDLVMTEAPNNKTDLMENASRRIEQFPIKFMTITFK